MFAVSLISQYMSNPGPVHMKFLENILLYLKGVQDMPLRMTRKTLEWLVATGWAVLFSDASLGNRDARRSQTCWLAFLFGNLVGWNSRYQPAVALSVAESEFMALSAAGQFACWFVREINELGVRKLDGVKIFCDNQSAIHISHNPLFNKYTKHIDLRFEWIKQAVQRKIIVPLFMRTKDNLSDIGTKALHPQHFIAFTKVLLGHLRLCLRDESECEQFDEMVIRSAGMQMNAIAFSALCYSRDHHCFIHASCYIPDDAPRI